MNRWTKKAYFPFMAALSLAFLFQSGKRINIFTAGPAAMVPASTQGIFCLKSLGYALDGMGGSTGKLMQQATALNPEEKVDSASIEKKIIETFGFDPVSPKSYKAMGISTDRPLAIAVPSWSFASWGRRPEPEVLILLPVDDPEKFEKSMVGLIKELIVKSDDEAKKVAVASNGDIKGIFIGRKRLFVYNVLDGYARIALNPGTLYWSNNVSRKDSLADFGQFKKSAQGAPQNASYFVYMNAVELAGIRVSMEYSARLKPGSLREWFSDTEGIMIAGQREAGHSVGYFSVPAPLNPNFRRMLQGQGDLAALVKKLPADPVLLLKAPLDYMALAKMVLSFKSVFKGVGRVYESEGAVVIEGGDAEVEQIQMRRKALKDIMPILGKGLLLALYSSTNTETGNSPDAKKESLKFMAAAPTADAGMARDVVAKVAKAIEGDDKNPLERIEMPDSLLYGTSQDLYQLLGKKKRHSKIENDMYSIFTAAVSYYAEKGQWPKKFSETYWAPYEMSEYSFYLSCDEVMKLSESNYSGCPAELKAWFNKPCAGEPGSCFRAGAVAKTPGGLDIWGIDEQKNLQHLAVAEPSAGETKIIFGLLGSNLVMTNDRNILKNMEKGGRGPSAYDFAIKTSQTRAMNDPSTILAIMQGNFWKGLLANKNSPLTLASQKIHKLNRVLDDKMIEKIYPGNSLSAITIGIRGDALVCYRYSEEGQGVSPVGTVLAMAIPSFIGFQTKARQSEAKTNLAAIFTMEMAYFGEMNQWGKTFKEIQWYPQGKRRYSYYLSCEEVIPSEETGYKECPAKLKEWLARPCEEKTGCFRAGAVGNIDGDPFLDIWVIDETKTLKNLMDDSMD